MPFLDHRIVEFGLGLPDALKVQGRIGKLLLRRWGQRLIPGAHLMGSKKGFHVPMGELLAGEFLTRLGAALAANEAVQHWFDADGVRQLIDAQRAAGGHTVPLWGLMQFAIWHRIFVEQQGRMPELDADPLDWIR